MNDGWDWWQSQLRYQNGECANKPECTPGTPFQGFFKLRVRTTEYAPILGQRRNKVTVTWKPVAIWNDGGWHMQIGGEDHYRNPELIDAIFARCCRNAIEYDVYEEMLRENERTDGQDFNSASEGAGRDSEPGEGCAESSL